MGTPSTARGTTRTALTRVFALQPPAPSFQDHLLWGTLSRSSRIPNTRRRNDTLLGRDGIPENKIIQFLGVHSGKRLWREDHHNGCDVSETILKSDA